ncbi:hypothetical protein ACFL0M_06385 [Thermodesulfobacteriota bacterium]
MGESRKHYYLHHLLLQFFLVLLILMFIGCATAPRKKEGPLPGEPVAEFPKLIVGDSWVVKVPSKKFGTDVSRSRVMKVNPDGSFIIENQFEKSKNKYHHYYYNKYERVKRVNQITGKYKVYADRRNLSFPLFIGKT